jgi:hypothetical protein
LGPLDSPVPRRPVPSPARVAICRRWRAHPSLDDRLGPAGRPQLLRHHSDPDAGGQCAPRAVHLPRRQQCDPTALLRCFVFHFFANRRTADKLPAGSSLLAAPREADIGQRVKDPPVGCHFRGPEMAHPVGRSIFHPRRPSLEADAFAYSLTRSRQRAVILLAPVRSPVYTFLPPVRPDSTGHFFLVCANTNSTSMAANQRHPRKCKSPANPLDSMAADSEATRLRFVTEHGGRDFGRRRTQLTTSR